jgi:hypothetical protein
MSFPCLGLRWRALACAVGITGGSGALRSERAFLGNRWQVTDPGRAAAAAARLDALARSSGPVDTDGAAFGGLAHAAGLGAILYRGWANREPRARLKRIAEGKIAGAGPAEAAIADAVGGTALAADAASRTADHAATQAAVSAASAAAAQAAADAATQAALDAATQSAVHAATHAAVHAAVQAATQAADAGGHGGAAGGHGH